MTKLDDKLPRLRDGSMGWDEFWRETRAEWESLAGSLKQRWGRDCVAVDVDDLAQDLLLAAWPALSQWDPARGVPLKSYVVFQAMSQAKRGLHKMRGANLHRPDREPSRSPLPESSLLSDSAEGEEGGSGPVARYSGREPEQFAVERGLDALALAGADAPLIEAVLRGDMVEASRLAGARRIGKRAAGLVVGEVVDAVVARIGAEP